MDVVLQPNERLDDLEYKSLFIIQKKGGYCFTSDAVLLANFVKATSREVVIDFGTGSGIIAILVAAKTATKNVIGLELQPRLADSARRSVSLNNLQERIKIVQGDIKAAKNLFGAGTADVVVCNPPYFRCNGTEANESDIAKSEVAITLSEVIKSAAEVLKFGGRFYIVNKAERLAETIALLHERDLEPKVLRLVEPKPDRVADTFLIEAKKGAAAGLRLMKTLVVYNSDGSMTDEARRIYSK